MIIYLAGGFYQTYKATIESYLGSEPFSFIDPESAPVAHQIPGCYVGRDLEAIRSSNLVIAYQDNYPFVYGVAAEIGYAVAMDKPVIYICQSDRVDGFLAGLARATFTDVKAACVFIRERYSKA